MSKYVTGYEPEVIPEGAKPTNNQPYLVGYSATPVWIIDSQREAETECATLRTYDVHIGPHYCDFAIETLADGRFTIVCTSHPDHLNGGPKLAKF